MFDIELKTVSRLRFYGLGSKKRIAEYPWGADTDAIVRGSSLRVDRSQDTSTVDQASCARCPRRHLRTWTGGSFCLVLAAGSGPYRTKRSSIKRKQQPGLCSYFPSYRPCELRFGRDTAERYVRGRGKGAHHCWHQCRFFLRDSLHNHRRVEI